VKPVFRRSADSDRRARRHHAPSSSANARSQRSRVQLGSSRRTCGNGSPSDLAPVNARTTRLPRRPPSGALIPDASMDHSDHAPPPGTFGR
jgi:hypothetical protein